MTFVVLLFFSLGKYSNFFQNRDLLLKSIAPVYIVFLIWDFSFIYLGFWGYNPRYISGLQFLSLPLEDFILYLIIPGYGILVYKLVGRHYDYHRISIYQNSISNFLMGFCASLAVVYSDRWYTVVTFGLLAALIYWHSKKNKTPWLGRFYLAQFIFSIPLLVILVVLTGTGLEEELIWFSTLQTMEQNILTVPIESLFFLMLMVLLSITVFEYLRGIRYSQNNPQNSLD